jgi:hypothetical protein
MGWGSVRSFFNDMPEPVWDADFQVFAIALDRAELRFELHDEDALHDSLIGIGRFELAETLDTSAEQTFAFRPGQGWRAAGRGLILSVHVHTPDAVPEIDAYVALRMGPRRQRTSKIANYRSPVWDENWRSSP